MEEEKLIKKKKLYLSKGNKLCLASVCNDLAELYEREGKYELSKNEYKNVAKLYKELDKPMFYAIANRMIGEVSTTLAEFEEALKYQTIHLDTAKAHKSQLEEQRALASIGRTYLTKAISDPDRLDTDALTSAHTSFLQSLSLCECITNVPKGELMDMKARLYLNIGVVKEHFGDFERAEEFINKCILICKNYEIFDQLQHGYFTLGLMHSKNENYRKAITNFNCALDIADRLSDKIPPLCAIYSAKADVLIKIGEFSSAKHVLIKACKLKSPNIAEQYSIKQNLKIVAAMCQAEDSLITTSVTDYKKRKELYEIMGDGLASLKVFDKAIDYYNKMMECSIACGDSGKQLLPVYVSLAQTYKDNKQYKLAYEYFQKDLEISQSNPEESYKTLLNIAHICELLKKPYEDVASYYNRAMNEATAINNQQILGKVISLFIHYQKRIGNYNEAAKLQKKLDSIDYQSSDSECEDERSDTFDIGNEIDIDALIDLADLSDEEAPRATRRRGRPIKVTKNDKGESQLHSACIKGNLALVMSLLEQQHPVNIRDYCGWFPIHEACNLGHLDIVRLLISKGAAINDRGGKECAGMTPLHDACCNGHLEVVELLLDNGASVLAQMDSGETPLDSLKVWRKKVQLDPIMQTFYETLVSRMTTIFEKAGRSTTHNTVENNDALYTEPPTRTPKRIKTISPIKSTNVSPQKTSPKKSSPKKLSPLIGSLRFTVDDNSDLNLPSGSGLRRPSSLDANSKKRTPIKRTSSFKSNKDSSDDENSKSVACNEYRRAIDGLRNRVSDPITNKNTKKAKNAYLSDEDVGENWLEEDFNINQPKKRKRVSNTTQGLLDSTGIRRTNSTNSRHSSPSFTELLLENDERENEFANLNMNSGYESADSSNSASSNKRKRNQLSLLESGFSRNRCDSPLNIYNTNISPVNCVENISKKVHKRQQKIHSFVNNHNNSEADSTTSPQNIIIPLLAINVRIENKLWRIPVQANEVNVLTIEWLAKEAAKRYYKQEGITPNLQLITKEGAILVNEDPLSMVFISATQAEEIQSNIVDWNLPPLPDRYAEACVSFKIAPNIQLRACLDECQGTLNLKFGNLIIQKHQFPPLFRALNRQNNLQQLDLSGHNLLNEGMQQLCCALPSLVQLRSLNLSRNNLTGEGIRLFSEIFTKTDQNVLKFLIDLNLSYNIFGSDALRHLAVICQKLKLRALHLAGCSLQEDIFDVYNNEFELNWSHLEIFDISYNELNSEAVIKFLSFLNFANISNLNISSNSKISVSGIAKSIAEHLNQHETRNIKSLNLAYCKVNDSEIWELLRVLTKSQVDSLTLCRNNDLTAVSLRRLLQHRPSISNLNLLGCRNIVQYFEEFTITTNPTNEKLKNLAISINRKKYLAEANFLMRLWKSEWGNRGKVKNTNDLVLQFLVED